MSPEAIARRLEELNQLYELWLSLRKVRVVERLGPDGRNGSADAK